MGNQPKSFWHIYYQLNKRSLKRSAKTVYYARTGKQVYWVKPPSNYLEYCKNNGLTPKLF